MSADLVMLKVFIFLNCTFVVPRFQIIIFGVQLRFPMLGEQLRKFLWIYFPPLFSMKVVGEIPGPSFLVTGLDVAKYGIIIVGGSQADAEKAAWKSRDVS